MGSNISVYLSEKALRTLDAAVERQASLDREQGLSGRKVASRSRIIEQLIEDSLAIDGPLSLSEIEYHVIALAEEYGAAKVSLFGSYARQEADALSDVDILLDKGDIKGLRVLDFQDELARRLGRPVDVVTTVGASERFLSNIAPDEVVLYEAG